MKIEKILEFTGNMAEKMSDDELSKIAERAMSMYENDRDSRADYIKKNKEASELAQQIAKDKTFPWPNAANIKYPLLATGTIQFASRTSGTILTGKDIVKAKITGDDPQGEKRKRGDRIGEHMTYQVLEEMPEWEPGHDRLFHVMPVAGSAFKKTWFEPSLGRNVSKLINLDDIVVNLNADPEDTPDTTSHIKEFTRNEVLERINGDLYVDIKEITDVPEKDDEDEKHIFIEQHGLFDLDGDGYKEPYIVTLFEESRKVARIVRRFDADSMLMNGNKVVKITADEYFTKYDFMPSFNNTYYGTGFGAILGPLNNVVNTLINQLADAGTITNLGGGFIANSARIPGGRTGFVPGEYKKVDIRGEDIRKAILPLTGAQPSQVTFMLLEMLLGAGEKLASTTDVMTGQTPGPNVAAATVMALIEQGQQVLSSIQRRIHRSMKAEFKKLYMLNRKFLEPKSYFKVLDNPRVIHKTDYEFDDTDVQPVSDPSVVSEAHKLAKAEALFQTRNEPGANHQEIMRRYYEALGLPDIESLFAEPKGPPPELMLEIEKLKLKRRELDIKDTEVQAKLEKMESEMILNLAKAEAQEAGQQIEEYKQELEQIKLSMEVEKTLDERRRVSGVEGAPGNGTSPAAPQTPQAGGGGLPSGGGLS